MTNPMQKTAAPVDPGAAAPHLALNHLEYSYESGPPVLADITAQIPHGAVVGIVGPSGCGKSTLLSIIAGLYRPAAGTIDWVRDPADKGRHPLSMMFQADTLLPWRTVEQNVALHYRLRPSKLGKAERKDRVRELIRLAGLTGSEDKYPYQLSGGMRRRTAFLAAVTPGPSTLLLDEPFSSLDEPTRISIHQDIYGVIKRERITTILVTHDLAEAISLSDVVLVLSARPARVFTAYRIPFGRERTMLSLRDEPEFLQTYGALWEQLAVQIANSNRETGPER